MTGRADWQRFCARGWLRFDTDPEVVTWVRHALPAARAAVADPEMAQWHVCEGTWFVGVDALPNDGAGRVGGSGPLTGTAVDFISRYMGPCPPWHRGQVSAVYPGYPRPRAGESDAAFRYRLRRDAAHVDGVRAQGKERRRRIEDPHAFILGLPLTRADPGAAPLVAWEGSHRIMRAAFADLLAGSAPQAVSQVDVTEAYVNARKRCFETCRRVPLPSAPGQAILLHRLCLHGVAPWAAGAKAGSDGRMIAYFRPELARGVHDWLRRP